MKTQKMSDAGRKTTANGKNLTNCALCGGNRFRILRTQQNGWKLGLCQNCGFVQITPKPTETQVADLYDRDWPHFAPYISQTEIHRAYFRKLLNWIQERVGKPIAGLRILDIGCATGLLLEEAGKCDGWATGIDISADAAADCRKRGLDVHTGRMTDYAKKTHVPMYDIVTALEVIEHEYDPAQMVAAVRNVLSPTGIFIMTTPNFDTPWRTLMGERWVGYQHPEHLWFFTPASITKLLQDAGFTNISVRPDFPRSYELSYAFRRLADYFPAASGILRIFERITHALHLTNPINPWGDILVFARR